jgi:hypothetical protein
VLGSLTLLLSSKCHGIRGCTLSECGCQRLNSCAVSMALGLWGDAEEAQYILATSRSEN